MTFPRLCLLSVVLATSPLTAESFVRGDANVDGLLNVADSVKMLGYSFLSDPVACEDALDVNDDGAIDVADPIFFLNFLFMAGPLPLEPYPNCGEDPTGDSIDCAEYWPCTPAESLFEYRKTLLPRALAAVQGDFDLDGAEDIVFAGDPLFCSCEQLDFIRNNGDGSIGPWAETFIGMDPTDLLAENLDGDATLDIVMLSDNSEEMSVALGAGDGTFTVSTPVDLGIPIDGAATGDFDGDLVADLVLRSDGDLVFMPGIGDGTFGPPITTPLGGALTGKLAVGDLDGDGLFDVVLDDRDNDQVTVAYAIGGGGFSSGPTYATSSDPGEAALADMNGDGSLDLVVSHLFFEFVGIRLNDGSGGFGPQVLFPADWGSIRVREVNGDGDADVLLLSAEGITLLLGNGDGTLGSSHSASVAVGGVGLAVDLDTDGVREIVTINNRDLTVTSVESGGELVRPPLYETGSVSRCVEVGDWNQDGIPDLAVSNILSDDVSILLGVGDGTFEPTINYPVGSAPEFVTSGDIDNDGDFDLVVVGNELLTVLLGSGGGAFSPGGVTSLTGGPMSVALADFDEDGNLDFVAAIFWGGGMAIGLGDGTGTFSPPAVVSVPGNSRRVGVADLNSDGHLDVVVSGTFPPWVRLGNGDGTFGAATTASVRPDSYSFFELADVSADGVSDILSASNDERARVTRGNGTGGFTSNFDTYAVGAVPTSIVIGDFDGDAVSDFVVAHGLSRDIALIVGDGVGGYQEQVRFQAFDSVADVGAADFDLDGDLDLVTVGDLGATVLLNRLFP